MTRRRALSIAAVAAAAAVAATGGWGAQEPRLAGSRMETHSAADGLRRRIDALVERDRPAAWIGYAVPSPPRVRWICCFDSRVGSKRWQPTECGAGCRLESEGGIYTHSDGGSCVADHPWDRVLVLLRLTGRRITNVRVFTPDCPLDTALPFDWLTDVVPEESVRLLASIVEREPGSSWSVDDRLPGKALMALALHAHDSADRALEQLVAPGRPVKLREQAAFWMGRERGRRGFDTLRRLARDDRDPGFRKHLPFAIAESRQPDAAEELVRMARNDPSPEVRGQAIFWLAQHAGRAAVPAITEAMESDPEVDVKKKAVFALSQLPPDAGVPLLIKVARTHKNYVLRKEAIFWLGESRDPRALDFLEEIVLGASARPES